METDLSRLWARRAVLRERLGCVLTVRRLFVLLLALVRARIEPVDVQAAVLDVDEHGPYREALASLAGTKSAYGYLYRLHTAGLLVPDGGRGCYVLAAHARATLERVLALERRTEVEPGPCDDPEVSYSVHVAELDAPFGERIPVMAL